MHDTKIKGEIQSYREMKDENERKYFERALIISKGNKTKLSQLVSLSRSVVYEKLKKHNLM